MLVKLPLITSFTILLSSTQKEAKVCVLFNTGSQRFISDELRHYLKLSVLRVFIKTFGKVLNIELIIHTYPPHTKSIFLVTFRLP